MELDTGTELESERELFHRLKGTGKTSERYAKLTLLMEQVKEKGCFQEYCGASPPLTRYHPGGETPCLSWRLSSDFFVYRNVPREQPVQNIL